MSRILLGHGGLREADRALHGADGVPGQEDEGTAGKVLPPPRRAGTDQRLLLVHP